MSRCVVWECVAALDLGDMPAPAQEEKRRGEEHPHVKAPTSLPVQQLSSTLLALLLSLSLLAPTLCYIALFNVPPPPRYPEVAQFGLRSE